MTEIMVVLIIVAIIQIAVLFTFFGMNAKLGKIQFYLSRMARHSGALEGVTGQALSSKGTHPKTPWSCPKCKHQNAYWDENCGKCDEPR